MKKMLIKVCALGLTTTLLLVGCGSKEAVKTEEDTSVIYTSGTYEGKSDPDQRGAYGIVKLSIKGDKIISADYKEYLQNGQVKDENYGKVIDEKTGALDEESYKKAQSAVNGQKQYGGKLVEAQDIIKVDVISGASSSHKTFTNAVNKALEQAKK